MCKKIVLHAMTKKGYEVATLLFEKYREIVDFLVIGKDKNIKEIATAIIAVASNSTDVYTNLTRVIYGINKFKSDLKNFIDGENLNENEKKLGYALMDLFENYEIIFMGADNNKFNKNVILLSLREMTNLSTKEIRNSMKKYKKLLKL